MFFFFFFFWESPQVKTQTIKYLNYGFFLMTTWERVNLSSLMCTSQAAAMSCVFLCGLCSCLLEAPVPWVCLSWQLCVLVKYLSFLVCRQHAQRKLGHSQVLKIFGCSASCIKLQATPSVSPVCISLCWHYCDFFFFLHTKPNLWRDHCGKAQLDAH